MTSADVRTGKPSVVVVGFDDSEGARQAVRWAAREASLRQGTLHIVHALDQPLTAAVYGSQPAVKLADVQEEEARKVICPPVAETRHDHPEVEVIPWLGQEEPARAITAVSADVDAGLVVLGCSGHSAIPRVLLGSTAADIVHVAERPTVVVRGRGKGQPHTDAPVLVGVDGSPASERVLGVAFEYAALHNNSVHVIHSAAGRWIDRVEPTFHAHEEPVPTPGAAAAEFSNRHLQRWRDRCPQVPVTFEIVGDKPAQALLERTGHASLVVVGTRQHGSLRRTVFGSVSHAMLYHADCPVAIVPSLPENKIE